MNFSFTNGWSTEARQNNLTHEAAKGKSGCGDSKGGMHEELDRLRSMWSRLALTHFEISIHCLYFTENIFRTSIANVIPLYCSIVFQY